MASTTRSASRPDPSPLTELHVGDKLEFVVGYTDTTTMLHDQIYGTRNGKVEVVWPVLGRGKLQ